MPEHQTTARECPRCGLWRRADGACWRDFGDCPMSNKTTERSMVDNEWYNEMHNRLFDAIAAAQRARGNKCDPDGDPCGADCACLRLVRDDLESRIP